MEVVEEDHRKQTPTYTKLKLISHVTSRGSRNIARRITLISGIKDVYGAREDKRRFIYLDQ
jgi:hypothetical protein